MASWKPGEAGEARAWPRHRLRASTRTSLATWPCIAEVEVDRASGKVRVPQVWAAVDSGLVINPDGLTNQMEGGIIQSVSWTLYEQVRFDKNGITSRDWATLSDH